MRVLLVFLVLTLAGCEAHHLFGPTKPSVRVTPRDYIPDKCYFTITVNGVIHLYEIPCDD